MGRSGRGRRAGAFGVVAALAVLVAAGAAPAQAPAGAQSPESASGLQPKMTWAEFNKIPKAAATRRIPYGRAPSQFVELWQPSGLGPHPTVIMIHGGCWQANVASLDIMDLAAADLQARGIAVWNIEYRRVGEPGGGFPGTYRDVAKAVDLIRTYASAYNLDLKHVVVLGHSAGGHLALWAAARPKIAPTSPLHDADPLPVHGVVDLAGIPDLEHDNVTACGAAVLKAMTGEPTAARPDVYADTSPIVMLPLHVRQVVLHGAQDDTVPPAVGRAYVKAALAAHDPVVFVSPPGGHVEEITPGTPAWSRAAAAVRDMVGPNPPSAGAR